MQSYMKDGAPFVAMVIVMCGEMAMLTASKAALNTGINNFIFVVYCNALGTLILLPYFVFRRYRSKSPPISFSLLWKLFFQALLGKCLMQIAGYPGLNYSSPTLAAAISNLVPAFTFLLAIIFRMEKINIKSFSSQAKILGTTLAISGALVVTLYKGPSILSGAPSPANLTDKFLVLDQSKWVLGAAFLTVSYFFSACGNIVQTAIVNEYPDRLTIVFLYNLFGTIQCAIFTLISERNPEAWTLHSGIAIFAILYTGIYITVLMDNVIAWCLLEKGPLYVVMFRPLVIAIAQVMGVIFLRETLYLGSIIGSIVIAAGFYAVMHGQAAEEEDIAPKEVCKMEPSMDKTPLLHNCTGVADDSV
ncbi:hypothetical protein U1Q18_047449 [Sarracenia purpurea var. burkii]